MHYQSSNTATITVEVHAIEKNKNTFFITTWIYREVIVQFAESLLTSNLFNIDSSGTIQDDKVTEAPSLSKTGRIWG